MPIKIRSLEALRAWNANPTEEKKVIVMEWFYDYFFGLLEEKKFDEAKEAIEEMIVLGTKHDGLSREESETINLRNLAYYSGYAGRWGIALQEFLPTISWAKVRAEAISSR